MVHPIQYQVGGGITAVEDSGVLRAAGGESDHRESSSTKKNKKRVYANDNKNSSDEPSIGTGSVLQIYSPQCAAGLSNALLFGSCVTVSTESTDDGFDINLHHGSPKALAYKVCNVIWLMHVWFIN